MAMPTSYKENPDGTWTRIELAASAPTKERLIQIIMEYFYDKELPTLVPTSNPKIFSVTKANGKELGDCWRVKQMGKRWRFELVHKEENVL